MSKPEAVLPGKAEQKGVPDEKVRWKEGRWDKGVLRTGGGTEDFWGLTEAE